MAGTVICDYINSANVSGGFLGIGQTWQDMNASRVGGVTYTNTTGKPIVVSVFFIIPSGTTDISLSVDTLTTNRLINYNQATFVGQYFTLTAIVQSGSVYRFSHTYNSWCELR